MSGGRVVLGNNTTTAGLNFTIDNAVMPFYELEMRTGNGASQDGAVLLSDVYISHALLLTDGILKAPTPYRVIFPTTALSPVELPTAFILGYAEMEDRNIGTAALDFLNLDMAAGADVGTLHLLRTTGPDGIRLIDGAVSIASTWDINATQVPTAGRNLQFRWVSPLDNAIDLSIATVYRRDGMAATWQQIDFPSPAAGEPRTRAAVGTTAFSEWTITDDFDILPVEWLSFTAEKNKDDKVLLTWKTAEEVNNSHFEIERSIDDAETFKPIYRAEPNAYRIYRYEDKNIRELGNRIAYYRIKQVDFDGSFSYSKIQSIHFETQEAEQNIAIYPNPFSQVFSLSFDIVKDEMLWIEITNTEGKILYQKTGALSSETKNTLVISELAHLPNGLYFIKVRTADNVFYQKIMKE
jgi:hypothetical protein